jgi:hypothetical protein
MFSLFYNKEAREFAEVKRFLSFHLGEFSKHESRVNPDLYDVTTFFLQENIALYDAMEILISKGHFRSCVSLARSLLENAVTLRYIYDDDSDTRARNYKRVAQHSFLQRVRNQDDPSILKATLEIYGDQIVDFNPKKEWPTLKMMFKEIKMDKQYDEWYGRLSEYAHSRYRNGGDLSEDRPFNNFLRKLVYRHVLLMILESLRVATEKFDLDGGVLIMDNYPDEGSVFFYSTNPKKMAPIELPESLLKAILHKVRKILRIQ